MKKILGFLIIAFIVWGMISAPVESAAMWSSIFATLRGWVAGITSFFQSLVSGAAA
jgi:hypothetical protein